MAAFKSLFAGTKNRLNRGFSRATKFLSKGVDGFRSEGL